MVETATVTAAASELSSARREKSSSQEAMDERRRTLGFGTERIDDVKGNVCEVHR